MVRIAGVGNDAVISVFTLNGKLVCLTGHQKDIGSIDISNLPAGVYLVKVVQYGQTRVGKILKHE
ncbi:MAG: T9SS type A sorting domain-containing protein [Bacteroidales bacterium]|nr:T9SS type A sorting domain-containing protein [Bacteroidales bacterium]